VAAFACFLKLVGDWIGVNAVPVSWGLLAFLLFLAVATKVAEVV